MQSVFAFIVSASFMTCTIQAYYTVSFSIAPPIFHMQSSACGIAQASHLVVRCTGCIAHVCIVPVCFASSYLPPSAVCISIRSTGWKDAVCVANPILNTVDRIERWFKCWRACARHPQPMQGAPWRSSAWKRNTAVKACMAHNTPAWFIGLVCDVSVVSCYSAVTVSKWSTACFTAFDSGFSDRAPCSTHCNKSTALTASAFLYLGIKSFNAQPV